MPERLPVVALFLLLALPAARAAEPGHTPRQLIDHLGVEIRLALENPEAGRTPEAAERDVADRVTALVRSSPGDDSLFDADEQGRTPLMLAASGGYPLVAKALLTDPIVRARINARNQAGETAWMIASFAPAMTHAACQPGTLTLERTPLLLPYLRRMSNLLAARPSPTVTLLAALEQAGARPDPEGARQAWLARCPNTSPELRQALGTGALQTTLVDHAVSRQTAFSKARREGRADIAQRPPPDMRFIAAGPREPVSRLKCRRKPMPSLPGALPWSGELRFRVAAATRAGVVEAVDLALLPGGEPDPLVVDYFRGVVLQTLAAYLCEGEHVFEQDFKFRIE